MPDMNMPEAMPPAQHRIRSSHDEALAAVQAQINNWIADPHEPIDAELAAIFYSPGHPGANDLLRRYAIQRGVKKSELAAEFQRAHIRETFGCIPTDPDHFVGIMAKREGLTVRVNGALDKDVRLVDITNPDGSVDRCPVPPPGDPCMDLFARHTHRAYTTLSDFRLECRTAAVNARLTFRPEAINDAADKWHAAQRRERLMYLEDSLWHTQMPAELKQARTDLLGLCAAAFDMEQHSAEYVAAAIQKFVWQVKRKMFGIPVTGHAMLVVLGLQNRGKSTLMRYLVSPLVELSAPADFREITDPRNIDLWSNRVLVLDEMGWASKADIDTVKNVITAETLTRRPMRSNSVQIIQQQATFIGASNKESLSDLIRDPTGVRRFISVRFADNPDHAVINGFDWGMLWRSIDPAVADPMLPFRDTVLERQEADREKTIVEQWCEWVVTSRGQEITGMIQNGSRMRGSPFYQMFRDWEETHHPHAKSSVSRFGLDLAQLRAEGRCPFRKARDLHGVYYVYDGRPQLSVLKSG